MTKKNFAVGIIGGGIGGLCLAQGLKKSGIVVRVYERDRSAQERLQGYRIHINPAGSRALHECLPADLYKRFVSTCGRSSGRFIFRSEAMEDLLTVETGEQTDPVSSHKSVSRITLREILLSDLEDIVQFDKKFVKYHTQVSGKIAISFEDGTSELCDVLVAGDGGNSRVRQQFLPHAKRVETGVIGIAGKLFLTEQSRALLAPKLLEGASLISTAHESSMFIAPFEFKHDSASPREAASTTTGTLNVDNLFDNSHDYIMWGFGAAKELYRPYGNLQELDSSQLQKIVLKLIERWHVDLQQLVRWSKPGTISLLPIRTSLPVKHWNTTNITLLGDAIHSMTPYRGIGANVALHDAALLCRQLKAADLGYNDLMQSIHDYEVQMLDYGFAAVNTSLKALEQAVTKNKIELALRRTAFRTINAVPPLKQFVFSAIGN